MKIILLDVCKFIENHFRLLAVDSNRQKELDVDPKVIQQIEFVRQLRNADGVNNLS